MNCGNCEYYKQDGVTVYGNCLKKHLNKYQQVSTGEYFNPIVRETYPICEQFKQRNDD